jgi:hypothetical protein
MVYMHRSVLRAPKGKLVDHRDMDGLNNLRSNLRIATQSENQRNRRSSPHTSRYKGVSIYRGNRWRAKIVLNGHQTHVGHFVDEVEAARAYDKKARELFGEFARTNFQINRKRGLKGHRWIPGADSHGCKLRVCLRCVNGRGQALWDFSNCKVPQKKVR